MILRIIRIAGLSEIEPYLSLANGVLPTQPALPCHAMARIGGFVRYRTVVILARLSFPGQGTGPDTSGHNRAFVRLAIV